MRNSKLHVYARVNFSQSETGSLLRGGGGGKERRRVKIFIAGGGGEINRNYPIPF